MPEFGYKISGMAGAERFFEAERLLDIKLRGFEKSAAEFEADGSRRQEYSRTEEDGSEKKVTLIKNVTESGTLVFSNFPLKFFRFGGKIFYLWDILPTALMGIFWWVLFPRVMASLDLNYYQGAFVQITAGVMWFIFGEIAVNLCRSIESKNRRHLRILFLPYRTRLRTEFLLRGGAVTAVCLVLSSFKLFAGWTKYEMLNKFLKSAIPALAVSVIPLFRKGRK